ncbi:MAG: S49 family peptidase [Micavibrio sp.]|nr:S49 family peptidase [Micavibrio sp.]
MGLALGEAPVIGGIFKPKPTVAVVRLAGVIADANMKRGGISHARFEQALQDAFEVHDLKALALIINSPGGSPAQSQMIGDHIRRLAEDKEIPVYAFVEDVAASGGYWLACAADEIYTQSTSIVGSIGVISASFGFQDLINKYGVERRIHTSGKDKSFLDPFRPESEEDVERLKSIQSDMHEIFIDWVKERRSGKLKGEDSELFEGAFWTGESALGLGLVDDFGEMRSHCKDKFGEKIKFKEFTPDKGFVASILRPDAKLGLSQEAMETLETKSVWARYGL